MLHKYKVKVATPSAREVWVSLADIIATDQRTQSKREKVNYQNGQ